MQHLQLYPHASDTPDGIRQWWLPPGLTGVEPALLAGVLNELVAEGLMLRLRLPDGGLLYGSRPPVEGTGG